MGISIGRLNAAATAVAIVASVALTNVAVATPIHGNDVSGGQGDVGIEACRIAGRGNACDPGLNSYDGVHLNGLSGNGRAVPIRPGGGGLVRARPRGIPVTEPATALLLLAGSFALGCVRRRRG